MRTPCIIPNNRGGPRGSMSKQHQEFFQEDSGGGKGSSEGGHYVRTMPTTTEIGLAREPLGLEA